jgi:cell division protein FtsB
MIPPEPRNRPERKRTGQLSGLQIMFAAILAIGLVLGLNFTSLVSAGQPLQQLYSKVTTEIDQLERERMELIRERNYVESDAYVEWWARDEGKMVRPGDTLIIPVPDGAAMEATPEPRPSVPIVTDERGTETWELWWALFFDGPPPRLP